MLVLLLLAALSSQTEGNLEIVNCSVMFICLGLRPYQLSCSVGLVHPHCID